ncbi:MAG: hypothetical protein ACN6OB_16265 [Chryseobacterium jejuense]|uniref:hypothetical protein n=1 Tax=Chryseobacterium jejuense TaxID=445960 RepID=UPI003D10596B
MKKLLFLAIFPLLLSCSKHQFDLEQLKFPIEKKVLNTAGVNTNEYPTFIEGEILSFTGNNDTVMVYGGMQLSGNLRRYNKNVDASNYVKFFEDPIHKDIRAYEIVLKTTEETEQLETYFDKNFGKTDFYYKDKEVSCRIWEKEKSLYYLGIHFDFNDPELLNKSRKTALLFVVDKSAKEIISKEAPQGDYFQFYRHYLEIKESPQHKNKKYTYREYIEQSRRENKSKEFDVIYFDNYIEN